MKWAESLLGNEQKASGCTVITDEQWLYTSAHWEWPGIGVSAWCVLSLLLPTKGCVGSRTILRTFYKSVIPKHIVLSQISGGSSWALLWLAMGSSTVVYILCILSLNSSGIGIVIQSLSFKKLLFSRKKALKLKSLVDYIYHYFCTGSVLLKVIWTTACQTIVFTVLPLLSLLVFIGEAQMYKLKKNCGNIFSKYRPRRELLGLLGFPLM